MIMFLKAWLWSRALFCRIRFQLYYKLTGWELSMIAVAFSTKPYHDSLHGVPACYQSHEYQSFFALIPLVGTSWLDILAEVKALSTYDAIVTNWTNSCLLSESVLMERLDGVRSHILKCGWWYQKSNSGFQLFKVSVQKMTCITGSGLIITLSNIQSH